MKTVLLLDADCALGRALCDALHAPDYRVIAHARSAGHEPFADDVEVIVADRPEQVLATWDAPRPPLDHVVFGQPRTSDAWHSRGPGPDGTAVDHIASQFDALATSLEAGLAGFLGELQAAGKVLARGNGGQIWVLTQEDSMQYCLDFQASQIESRARHAAVKSFAKEMLRFDVRINCAHVQLLREQAPSDAWQQAREGLKAFAMKFKPNRASTVAATLRGFLSQPELPIVGMIVPVGIGFTENNL